MDGILKLENVSLTYQSDTSETQAIKNLNEREKKILFLRFMQGKTQMEVADEIGISQAQVSRLEKGAIKRIKDNNKA